MLISRRQSFPACKRTLHPIQHDTETTPVYAARYAATAIAGHQHSLPLRYGGAIPPYWRHSTRYNWTRLFLVAVTGCSDSIMQ
jgi:hypothetical protein